jgi:hypothetical protein
VTEYRLAEPGVPLSSGGVMTAQVDGALRYTDSQQMAVRFTLPSGPESRKN